MTICFINFISNDNNYAVSVGGQKFQNNIFTGLLKNSYNLISLRINPMRSFPRAKLINKRNVINYANHIEYSIGFFNFPIIKYFSIRNNLRKTIRIIENQQKIDVFLTYNFYSYYSNILLGPKYSQKKILAILADLPIYLSKNIMTINYWFNLILNQKTKSALKKLDYAIVLNENVVGKFLKEDIKYDVIEGGVKKSQFSNYEDRKENNSRKNFLYAGSLDDYSGILEFARGFELFVEEYSDYVLDIYGKGKYEKIIKEISDKNSNINYYHHIENDLLVNKLRETYFLVNPRKIDTEIALYTFPSKMFDYFLSKKPILSTDLECLRNSYSKYLNKLDLSSPTNIKNSIVKLISIDYEYLMNKSHTGFEFVLKNKNWERQNLKLSNFIKENFS